MATHSTQTPMEESYGYTDTTQSLDPEVATDWGTQCTILVLCTVTLLINPVTLAAMVKGKLVRKSSINICLTSLCCSDLLFGLSTFLHYLPALSPNLAAGSDSLRKARFITTSFGLPGFMMSTLNCLLITLDRAIASLNPLKYKTKMTSDKTRRVIGALWLVTALFSAFVAATKVLVDGEFRVLHYPVETIPTRAFNYVIVPSIVLLFLTNVVLYAVTLRSLAKHAHRMHLNTTSLSEKRTNQITRMIVLVISVMLLGNLPIVVISTVSPSCPSHCSPSYAMSYRLAYDVFIAIAIVPTFVNNFIYFGRMADFKKYILGLFCCSEKSNSVSPSNVLNPSRNAPSNSHRNMAKTKF